MRSFYLDLLRRGFSFTSIFRKKKGVNVLLEIYQPKSMMLLHNLKSNLDKATSLLLKMIQIL